jgi:hypothetical protein
VGGGARPRIVARGGGSTDPVARPPAYMARTARVTPGPDRVCASRRVRRAVPAAVPLAPAARPPRLAGRAARATR